MSEKSKPKQLIMLDFDHTVFNTTLYIKTLRRRFHKDFGIAEDVYMQKREEVKKCCVVEDIDKFVKRLPHPDKKAMHDALHQITKTQARQFVFSDVKPFIKKHLPNFDIVLTTHGDKELQTEKIKHSNLPAGIMRSISLAPKAKVVAAYLKKYRHIHFIDDKAENIDAVKKVFPDKVTSYFIQRPEDKPYADKPSQCQCADKVVKGLNFKIR